MTARLLLVDDDPNILESSKDILEDAGYQVAVAATLEEALIQIRRLDVQLLLVDFNLPDGTGVNLARSAKTERPQLKVILMTGEAHVDLSGAPGAIDRVLTKPVDPPQLFDAIQQLLPA